MNTDWTEERPWGRFKNLLDTEYTKVKLIEVDPMKRLSYQSHKNRRESWTVVTGTAIVILDDIKHELQPGSHIEIPIGAKHRLANQSRDSLLRVVEVQTGSYFGEDDIERFADDWRRT